MRNRVWKQNSPGNGLYMRIVRAAKNIFCAVSKESYCPSQLAA
jgi:hypothetical protein